MARGSRTRATSSCRATRTSRGSATATALVGEIEEFLTGSRPRSSTPTACSRPCCSPTSSARPRARRRSATAPGAIFSTATTRSSATRDRPLPRPRGRHQPATASSPPSTARRAHPLRPGDPRRGASLGLEIRAGLHTGECERVDDDIAGIAVHTAARVMAQADPGEILVSSTVKDLVAGSGLSFADRGTHTLRGIPGEWRLSAVV